jgi:hypothetical protein
MNGYIPAFIITLVAIIGFLIGYFNSSGIGNTISLVGIFVSLFGLGIVMYLMSSDISEKLR